MTLPLPGPHEISLAQLLIICAAGLVAGFVDAIVGGGGLIQIPMALLAFPLLLPAPVIGSTKVSSFTGASVALFRYSKAIRFHMWPCLTMGILSFLASLVGSSALARMESDVYKSILLVLLPCVALLIAFKRDLGLHDREDAIADHHTVTQHAVYAIAISTTIGFYDGLVGLGTGTLLILLFIALLDYNFLRATGTAKIVNMAANLGTIIYFASAGKLIWLIAIPMAIMNGIGGYIGSHLAISKGNTFIRAFFLIVVMGTVVRFAIDLF